MGNSIDKVVIEMPDDERRFERIQKLHEEGYRTLQETPTKVVLIKFI